MTHVTQLFCFLALAFALIVLSVPLERRSVVRGSIAVTFSFFALWWGAIAAQDTPRTVASLTGARTARFVWDVLHYKSLVRSLQDTARQNSAEWGLDPEIRKIVGQKTVAFLSHVYST